MTVALDRGDRHQVRVTVVGEQELDRRVRQRHRERVADDVEHLGLVLGHLECVQQLGLEVLMLPLALPS